MLRKMTTLFAVMALVLSLASCGILSEMGIVAQNGDVAVVVENSEGEYDVYYADLEDVENKEEGAKGILEQLSERKINALYLEMTESTYGAYVSAIGDIKEGNGYYVIVYTSDSTDSYEGAPTLDYEGTTLYQAGVGLSSMKIADGTVILLRLEKSPY